MPLSHAAPPLHGHVRPRQGPVSIGLVSAGGAASSGAVIASASWSIVTSPPASTGPASLTTQTFAVVSHSSPLLHPVTEHGATHWCVLRSHTSLPGHTAAPDTHSKTGTSL